MALDFKNNRKYILTSFGAPENGIFPTDTILSNINRVIDRRVNPLKVILYLIRQERNCRNFRVGDSDAIKFCHLGSGFVKALNELVETGFIEWNEKYIIVRYDRLMKE